MPKLIERAQSAANQVKWTALWGAGVAGGTSGLAGVGTSISAGLAGAGYTATAGAVALAVGALPVAGGLVAVGAVGYAAYLALWPKRREDYHDVKVPLADLHDEFWSCHIIRVAVVGVSRSGKTEIKSKLREKARGDLNTKFIENHVFRLDADAGVFVALIDGKGASLEEREQQFIIGENAQVLVVVLDHNPQDDATEILQVRLDEQSEFMNQLRNHLKQKKRNDKIKIIFCLNKSDLWVNDKHEKIALLKSWFLNEVKEWRKLNISVLDKPIEIAAKTGSNVDIVKKEIVRSATSEQ
jgi:hypothetical protein